MRRAVVVLAVVASVLAGAVVVRAQTAGPPRVAVLARADDPVDALSASAAAAQLGGVVLLTDPQALSPAARAGLEAFDPDLVVLAGGEQALGPAVAAQAATVAEVRRVSGATRLETSRALAALPAELGPAFLPVGGTAADARQLAGLDLDELAATLGTARTVVRRAEPEEPVDLSGEGTYLVTADVEAPVDGVVSARCEASLFANGDGYVTGGLVVAIGDAATRVPATLTLTPQERNAFTDGASVTDTFALPVAAGTHSVGCYAGQGAGDVTLFAGPAALTATFAPAAQADAGPAPTPSPAPPR